MDQKVSGSRGHGPHPLIRLLALFWLGGAMLALLMGVGLWPDGAEDWSGSTRWVLIAAAFAGLLFGLSLMWGKLWAQPAAILYHFWLALAMLLWLFAEWPFEGVGESLPAFLAPDSWSGPMAFLLFGLTLAALLLLLSYRFSQREAWQLFATTDAPRLNKLCSGCGATLDNKNGEASPWEKCAYCDAPQQIKYFLRPMVFGAHRVLLPFELGHWRVQIGRGVPAHSEARLQHERYKSIGRYHAYIEMNPQSKQLMISSAGLHYEIMVNDELIYQSSAVQTGDIIKLSDVEFILEADDDDVVLAYLISLENQNLRYRLLFSVRQFARTIGRAKNNDVVLPPDWRGVSSKHATILYEPKAKTFYIYNDSTREGTLRVDGDMVIEHGKNYDLDHQRTYLTFDRHDFVFVPVPYEVDANGGKAS